MNDRAEWALLVTVMVVGTFTLLWAYGSEW